MIGTARPQAAAGLARGQATVLDWHEHAIIVERTDALGEITLEISLPTSQAQAFARALCDLAELPELDTDSGQRQREPTPTQARIRLRRAGWLALNVARIEAGTPLFNLDFGPSNLPAETGVLRDRVSFKKGCYLGQEVVARMDALGKPKQVLVGLRLDPPADPASPTPQPAHAARVFELGAPGTPGDEVGAVTSSTLSPMLGGAAIGFAQVKTKVGEHEGARVLVEAEGALRPATVQARLPFWARD
jgi:folate-binding protein YgfZ